MAWAKNGTPDTLTSGSSSMTISDLTAVKFNQFLTRTLRPGTGTPAPSYRLDNTSATDYASRYSTNGGADATNVSETSARGYTSASDKDQGMFVVIYGINIASEEKLQISHTIGANTTGAGTAPVRSEHATKMDTTTNSGQYTRFDIIDTGSDNFDTDSNLSAIGSD